MKPIQIPSEGGKKLNVLGIPMVLRLHGRDTGGVVSAVESHDIQAVAHRRTYTIARMKLFRSLKVITSGPLAAIPSSPKRLHHFCAARHSPYLPLSRQNARPPPVRYHSIRLRRIL